MTAPIWIDVRDARTVHDRLLALHGGAAGLRHEGMLESALARPRQLYAYTTNDGQLRLPTTTQFTPPPRHATCVPHDLMRQTRGEAARPVVSLRTGDAERVIAALDPLAMKLGVRYEF